MYICTEQKKIDIMVTLIRQSETLKIEESKVNLYVSCGWVVVEELFKFNNKEEENEDWLKRFGN